MSDAGAVVVSPRGLESLTFVLSRWALVVVEHAVRQSSGHYLKAKVEYIPAKRQAKLIEINPKRAERFRARPLASRRGQTTS
jgi:hypothetical protein